MSFSRYRQEFGESTEGQKLLEDRYYRRSPVRAMSTVDGGEATMTIKALEAAIAVLKTYKGDKK